MDNYKMLIIEDDLNICELVSLYAKKDGFEVEISNDGEDALSKYSKFNPSIIILDIMLPKKDGLEVCKTIREKSNVPIIMLTARGETFDKVIGLETGADDYMVKPFEMKELMARVKAVLRRSDLAKQEYSDDEISVGDLIINQTKHEVLIGDKKIQLPLKEFELLSFLVKNINKVYSREQLLEKIWGYDFVKDSRTVDVHIKRLREKIEGPQYPWKINTVWRVGYKFEMK